MPQTIGSPSTPYSAQVPGGRHCRSSDGPSRSFGVRAKGQRRCGSSRALGVGPVVCMPADAPLQGLSATHAGRAMGSPIAHPARAARFVRWLAWSERSGVNGGRASRSGAQPQASTERVSTRRSTPLMPTQRPSLTPGAGSALLPAPLPFGENGVPRGSASWSRPQAAKVGQVAMGGLASSSRSASVLLPDRLPSPACSASSGLNPCAYAPPRAKRVRARVPSFPAYLALLEWPHWRRVAPAAFGWPAACLPRAGTHLDRHGG